MNIMKLAVAAAIAFGTMSAASAPAAAQDDQRGEMRRDSDRHDMRRGDDRRDDRRWRGDRGGHYGWRNGRHRGWYNRRICRIVWRYGHRQRICRTIRYRR